MKFRNKYSLLVVAIAAAYPLAGHGAAGVAQFTSGDVTVRRGAGTDALTKGKNVESGDAIVTGANGRAQVRFSDGGLVALAPNSQFNITRYADANDPKQDSFLVDLLRGGMRAVTGLIGKRNRDNYKVTTQTATIGIRGSAFELSYGPDGTLLVSTQMDEIEVCTRAGCVGLTAGESARVTSNDALATRTNTRTSIVTPPPRQLPEVASNQVDGEGVSTIVQTTHTPAPPPAQPKGPKVYTGMAMAFSGLRVAPPVQTENALSVMTGEGYGISGTLTGALQTDVNGHPEQFQSTDNTNLLRDGTTTIVSETGTYEGGDLMVLGTWEKAKYTSTMSPPTVYVPVTGDISPFAFVTGVATPASSLAQMAGMRGEYSLASATDVFVSNGTKGTLLGTSKLGVDFTGAASALVDVYLDVLVPNSAIGFATTYDMRGRLSATDGTFAGSVSCATEDCYGYASGFFGGPEAKKIGLSYQGYRSYGVEEEFGGAAVFQQGPLSPIPAVTIEQYFEGVFAYNNSSSYSSPFTSSGYGTFVGNGLTKIAPPFSPGMGTEKGSSATFAYDGSSTWGTNEPSNSEFIGWGYWSTGSKYGTGAVNDVHYVVGKPTSSIPWTGQATYTMIGHTTPTSTNGGAGSLLSASLTADFFSGGGTVNASVSTKFGATQVDIAKTGMGISGGKFSGSGTDGSISGMFTGSYAERAGYVFSTNHGTLGTVSGAAAFKMTGYPVPN